MVQSFFRDVGFPFDCQQRREGHSRTQVMRRIFLDPVHESGSFFFETDSKKTVNSECGIPQPRVAIVPVAAVSNHLREACRRSRDDRPRRLVGEKLQCQRRSLNLFSPAPVIGAGRQPPVPELHRLLKQFFGLTFCRRTRHAGPGFGRVENKDFRLPLLQTESGDNTAVSVETQRYCAA